MKCLDLFSGIGGFSVGLEGAGMETIAFCEKDPFCRQVLKKHWPHVPIHHDIGELDGRQYRGTARLVCGGFPCQPYSLASRDRLGSQDDRALWPEMFRVIKEVRPDWVALENVVGIIDMELDTVLSQLGVEGYTTEPFVLPACAQDARHIRSRVFVLAHTYDERIQRGEEPRIDGQNWQDPDDKYIERCGGSGLGVQHGEWEAAWIAEPRILRISHGIPDRIHRIKALGNAVVPPLIRVLGEVIMEADCYFRDDYMILDSAED